MTPSNQPKKPKAEMKDAYTQTERSDYAVIKAKREMKRKEQEEM